MIPLLRLKISEEPIQIYLDEAFKYQVNGFISQITVT